MPFKHKSNNQANGSAAATKPVQSWRDVLEIHPAAALLPLMSPDELRELGEDIRKNGLREPVVLQKQYRRRADGKFDVREYDLVLLDGRNRLDAMEGAGFVLVRNGKLDKTLGHAALGLEPLTGGAYAELDPDIDPYAFVISRNIHRRHLTAEKKRDLIAKLLKAMPEKSDRQIAKTVKVDHKTVGAVRTEQEARGEIPHVESRIDRNGRRQPAKKAGTRKKETNPPPQVSRDDISSDSRGESAPLQARIDELQAAKRQLEIKIKGYESEIEDLKAQQASKPDVVTTEALAALTLPRFLEIMPPAWRQPLAAKVRRLSNPDAPEADFPETEILRRALSLVKVAPISAAVAASNEKEALAALQQLSAAIARGGRDLNEVAIIGSSAKREKPRAA